VAAGDELCARTGAAVVHRVGKILILWRPRPAEAD
jgi:RNA-binding protein YhbY